MKENEFSEHIHIAWFVFICFWVNDVSYVMPNDRSAQNYVRTRCIGMVWLQYASDSAWSIHPNVQNAIRIPARNTCTVSLLVGWKKKKRKQLVYLSKWIKIYIFWDSSPKKKTNKKTLRIILLIVYFRARWVQKSHRDTEILRLFNGHESERYVLFQLIKFWKQRHRNSKLNDNTSTHI